MGHMCVRVVWLRTLIESIKAAWHEHGRDCGTGDCLQNLASAHTQRIGFAASACSVQWGRRAAPGGVAAGAAPLAAWSGRAPLHMARMKARPSISNACTRLLTWFIPATLVTASFPF